MCLKQNPSPISLCQRLPWWIVLNQARNLRFTPDSFISFPHPPSLPNLTSPESRVVCHGKVSSGLFPPLPLHCLCLNSGSSSSSHSPKLLTVSHYFHSRAKIFLEWKHDHTSPLVKTSDHLSSPWNQAQLYWSFLRRDPHLSFWPHDPLPLNALDCRLRSRSANVFCKRSVSKYTRLWPVVSVANYPALVALKQL